MKLMNKGLEARFKKIGSQDGKGEEAIVVVKYFNPAGSGTWYATEYEPESRIFFGYVSIFGDECDEWGSFALEELETFRGGFGLGIERDLHCGELPLKDFNIKSLQ